MAVADRNGLPVAVCVESATPHEVKLATSTLFQMVIPDAPQSLIGDNAYDSDKLDTELSTYVTCLAFLIHVELRISAFRQTRWACDSQVYCAVARCCNPDVS